MNDIIGSLSLCNIEWIDHAVLVISGIVRIFFNVYLRESCFFLFIEVMDFWLELLCWIFFYLEMVILWDDF